MDTTDHVNPKAASLLDFVNPLQGTDSREDFSRGNTLPLLCTPFPMTAWTLQTDEGRWAFRWTDGKIQGIRATHQPSPWMGDHGHFTIMPQRGECLMTAFQRGSSYDRGSLISRPDYLRVRLLRENCVLEATPTERCLKVRIQFNDRGQARLILDCFHQGGSLELDTARRILHGASKANYGGVPGNFAMRFALKINVDAALVRAGEGESVLGALEFEIPADGLVECEIATSYIGDEQAERNLEQEIGAKSFDEVRAEAVAAWEKRLERIQVDSSDATLKKVFYSCFYRTLTFPHKMHEVDAKGETVHYSPYDGRVHPGVLYAGHGFWDTYRTAYPLYSLLFPEDYADFLRGWMNACKEGGWYPRWPSPGYRVCMLSTHVDAVFADAMLKNIGGFDLEEAYEGLRRHAFENLEEDTGFGRPGLAAYLELGYIPADRYRHSVAATLDNAYCDYCLAQIATRLGRDEDARILTARALSYRHLFDPSVGFMRGKNADGSWLEPFEEFYWGGPYVEGGPWQTSWGVPHDVEGLIALYGGREKFVEKLDKMMITPPHFTVGDYGFEIHEMSEMAVANYGQYAQSNQPVHHVLYLFAAAGAPEKTDHWVREILTGYYSVDHFPGDEDNGEMSAWFVLSALGIFPLCPGKPEYTLTRPLFERARVHLGSGEILEIARKGVPASNNHDSFKLNDIVIGGRQISHEILVKGGNLSCESGPASDLAAKELEIPLYANK